MSTEAAPLVLFDGVCNLCSASVDFILRNEQASVLQFGSLQSTRAREAIEKVGGTWTREPASMMLIEEGRLFERSAAALRIARYLRWPYRWAYALLVIPAPLRDAIYGWVARNRYRWFGKRDSCRVPTPELRARFVD